MHPCPTLHGRSDPSSSTISDNALRFALLIGGKSRLARQRSFQFDSTVILTQGRPQFKGFGEKWEDDLQAGSIIIYRSTLTVEMVPVSNRALWLIPAERILTSHSSYRCRAVEPCGGAHDLPSRGPIKATFLAQDTPGSS